MSKPSSNTKKVSSKGASQRQSDLMAQIIEGAERRLTRITLKSYEVRPRGYQYVAGKIRSGRIAIQWISGSEPVFGAGYVRQRHAKDPRNVGGYILVPRPGAIGNDKWFRSLLVHEATHAIFDCQGARQRLTIHKYDDEVVAHIAQAAFLHKLGVLASEIATIPHSDVVQAARPAAVAFLRGQQPSQTEWKRVRSAVENFYAADPKIHRVYDGVDN